MMDLEVSIAARILVGGGKLPVAQEEILAALGADSPVAVTEDALAEYCRAVSEKSSCKVYIWMDREEYGNANVFNGGSDYEVVNEVCFLCVCDCGKETVRERTDRWNSKIEEVL
ncbi:MAG: hypothetical protein II121_04295 [Fibrobacter sp.]|nr:hypothetical protein [Fibrobacter sp.]